MFQPWDEVVQEKRRHLKSCIPSEWVNDSLKSDMVSKGFVNCRKYLDTIVPAEELSITTKTIPELAQLIATGTLSSVQCTTAFAHRAMLAHQILNCCSEIFIDKALERAKELDEVYAKSGKVIGPLHGIPISLKDQVDLKGIPSSIGYVSRANIAMKENALLADTLLDLGAVFFVKTCVPMAMMASETESNLYPYTYSAANINLSSGGSSGGEGSLIAAGGARMGFGTDIGGSIRIPACYNGIPAIKPSVGRVSYLRVSNSYEGQEAVPSVIGPMCQTLEEVELAMKLVVGSECWFKDPKVLPLPWREFKPQGKVRIGFWFDSGNVAPAPAITRTMEDTYAKLSKKPDVELVKVQWPDHLHTLDVLSSVYGADKGKEIMIECAKSGEPMHSLLKLFYDTEVSNPQTIEISEWWSVCQEIYKLKESLFRFWRENQLDGIIAPITPHTSTKPHGPMALDYTGVCNLNDCSSVVIPVGFVDAKIDISYAKPPRNELETKIHDWYSPEDYDGMPVCLQVITRKTEEEKGIAIAKIVQASL